LTITASNGVGSDAVQTFTLTVNAVATITSADATTFTEQVPGTFTVTSDGSPTAALSETGPLPTGVTFVDNGDGTATLAGTPAAGSRGTYPLTITATNGVGSPGSQSFTLTVNAAPAITSANATTFTEQVAGTFTVSSNGAPTPAVSETGPLPTGVTFVDNGDGTATLSGTPAAGTRGTYTLSITASNGVGADATQTFTLTVNAAPAITSANATTFTEQVAGTFTVSSNGAPTPAVSETGPLPTGVTFVDNGDGTATLAGTPAVGTRGTYTLTITAANGVGSDATQSFTLTVNAAPVITSANATTFTEQMAGTFTVMSNGAPTPAVTKTGALPTGVTFVDNGDGTATLSGTQAVGTAGTYTLSIKASNGVGADAIQSFTLTVNAVPTITSANKVTFSVGNAGNFTVRTTGSPAPALTETGTLPNGVAFNDRGNGTAVFFGTPAVGTTGTYGIFITANNGVGSPATQSFTLTISGIMITTASLPNTTLGTAYSVNLEATGGPLPYKWSIVAHDGTLPTGLRLVKKSGLIKGKSKVRGFYSFTVQVQDRQFNTATKQFVIQVN